MSSRLVTIVCLVLSCNGVATAEKSEPLPVKLLVEAAEFPYHTQVQLSPDEQWVTYSLQTVSRGKSNPNGLAQAFHRGKGVPAGVLGSDVWLTNIKTGRARRLTSGEGSSWSPVWSPNGERIAFYSDRNGTAELWIWDMTTSSIREATELPIWVTENFESPQWSRDGKKLLIRVIAPHSQLKPAAANRVPSNETGIDSEGRQLNEKKPKIVVYTGGIDPEEVPIQQRRSMASEAWKRSDLVLVDLTAHTAYHVARGFEPIWYRLSPDGTKLAFTDRLGREGSQPLVDLIVVDLAHGQPRIVASRIPTLSGVNFSWSPDSKKIAYTSSQFEKDQRLEGECFVVDIESRVGPLKFRSLLHPNFASEFRAPIWDQAARNIYLLSLSDPLLWRYDALWKLGVADRSAKELARVPDESLVEVISSSGTGRFWSPNQGRLMVVMTRDTGRFSDSLYSVDLTTGNCSKLYEGIGQSYGATYGPGWSISASGRCAVYKAQDAAHSENIWAICAENLHAPRQITTVNPEFDHYAMGTSKVIQWRGLDGESLQGALLLPARFKEGKRYPLVVYLYPGENRSAHVNEFGMSEVPIDNMQLLSSRGYVILEPDVPAMLMKDIPKEVLPGVEKVIELGIADPDRLAVMGHSNGGYGVLSILVQTSRFKAAICRSGYGDLIRRYTTMKSDGSSAYFMFVEEQVRVLGTLWEKRDVFIENSPIFYLDRMQTPLLITHGSNDVSVPPDLADEIFVSLRRLGKEVEYAKYEGEGHDESEWSGTNQVDFLNRVIGWLDLHLTTPE